MPLYELIRKYRVYQTFLIVSLTVVLYKFTNWITESPYADLENWHLAPVTAVLPAIIAGLFGVINTIMKKNESDDQ